MVLLALASILGKLLPTAVQYFVRDIESRVDALRGGKCISAFVPRQTMIKVIARCNILHLICIWSIFLFFPYPLVATTL